jgi:hypothetical protein
MYLDELGVEYEYETEKIKYTIPAKAHSYTPDFIFNTPSGRIYCEVKGRFDPATRQKMAHVIEQNPDKDIRLLFMRNNPINKGSSTTYGDWCDKRGIKWHVSAAGEVPEEWLK